MRYRNITISGLAGNGSTTLLRRLLKILEGEGWQGSTGSEYMTQYAREHELIPADSTERIDASIFSDEDERAIDLERRKRLRTEEKLILESWLSGFMAQGVPGVLKVLITCSSDFARTCRVAERDEKSMEEAERRNTERERVNVEKWRRMYREEWQKWVVDANRAMPDDPIDFYRPDLYDLVIDTYSAEEEEMLRRQEGAVLDKEALQAIRNTSSDRALQQVLDALRP